MPGSPICWGTTAGARHLCYEAQECRAPGDKRGALPLGQNTPAHAHQAPRVLPPPAPQSHLQAHGRLVLQFSSIMM